MAADTTALVAVLRDARRSALLRTRLIDAIEVKRTSERNTTRRRRRYLFAGLK
jgi:hypothetical protein